MCLCSPVPNASISEIATVPHTMPNTVRNVRSFSARKSRRSWRKTSFSVMVIALRDFFRRTLDQAIAFLHAIEDLDVESVADSGLDLDFLRLRFRIGLRHFDARLLAAVFVGDESLRNRQDVFLLADDHVGVRRVAGAQRDLLAGI